MILLFASFSATAQAPFKLKAFYPKNDIVEYPLGKTPRSLWIVVKEGGILATTYPVVGSVWQRPTEEATPVPTVPTIPTVPGAVDVPTKSAFDSLKAIVAALRESQATNTALDNLNKRVATIELNAPIYTLKVSQTGFPLLKINSDGSITLRSIVQGTSISTKVSMTDSTIVIPK